MTSRSNFSSFSGSQIGHLIHWAGFMVFVPPKIKGLLAFLGILENVDFDIIPACRLSKEAFLMKFLRFVFFIGYDSFLKK
jgi:hypothetical protein